MAAEINTSIEISGTKEQVWNALTSFSEYAQWNPFIKSLNGDVKEGSQITVEIQNMTFKPKVLSFKKNEEFVWLGRLFFRGLFDGKHQFRLTELSNGFTRFEHGEEFKGILVPLFKRKMLKRTLEGFEAMNLALKHRVENQAS